MQLKVEHIITEESEGQVKTRLSGDVCLRLRCWPDEVDVAIEEADVDEVRSQYVKKEGQKSKKVDPLESKKSPQELMDEAVAIIKKEFKEIIANYTNTLNQSSLVDVSAIENDLKAVK